MNRLGIFSFYDNEGTVGDYIDYLLCDLKTVLERLIIVVNGDLANEGRKIFEKYSKEIIIRENVGFDAGAYADVLLNYLSESEIKEYEEIVLCNDTFYGPFIPFKEIFNIINKENAEIWGLNKYNRGVFSYIQSNFLVFKKNIISSGKLLKFFDKININEKNIDNIYITFELGIYNYFKDDYITRTFTDTELLNIYFSPITGIERYNLPFLKKKCFDLKYNSIKAQENIINYISKNLDYKIEYIVLDIYRRKGLSLSIEQMKAVESENIVRYSQCKVSTTMLKRWIGKSEFYIYGCGLLAQKLYYNHLHNTELCKGFVVSDESKMREKYLMGKEIFCYDSIEKNTKIIVCVNYEYTQEIKNIIGEKDNILYLW